MRWIILLGAICVAGCSSPGTLGYTPPAQIIAGPPAIASVDVVDQRDEKPNRVATIRGGYGNPLKVMDTTTPVANEVRMVFMRALQARSMVADTGDDRIQILLHTLYGDQYIGRKVDLMFDIIVQDRSGRTIYTDRVAMKDYEFTFFDNGIFSSIETLGKHVETLLDKAVDEALDKPAFRAALASARTMTQGV